MSERSEPGRGPLVGIYMLAPDSWKDEVINGFGETAMCACVGEDFSKTRWPVIVKVKAEVGPGELANRLRDLANAVEKGFHATEQTRTELEGAKQPFITPQFVQD